MEKVRVLFVAANPPDTARLAVGEEYREIDARLRNSDGRDRFELVYAPEVSAAGLAQVLQRYRPTVVHFSGHGTAEGELVLPDASGESRPADPEAVARLFGALAGGLAIRCVVLNACYSEALARSLSEHIDCVIGMDVPVADRAAIAFAGAFYESLGFGNPVGAAFRVACAQVELQRPSRDQLPRLHVRDGARSDALHILPGDARANPLPDRKRSLPPPEGAYQREWYVRREREEQRALSYLSRPGSPAVLWGPELFGKSSMIQYLFETMAQEEDPRFATRVSIDLGLFDGSVRQSLDAFLQEFAIQLVDAVGGSPDWIEQVWRGPGGAPGKLTRLLGRHVMPRDGRCIVVAVDRSDAVLECPFHNDFFGMVRAWATNQSLSGLRLLLAISTTPTLLNSRLVQSPFNLTVPIDLSDLSDADVRDLAARHSLRWSDADVRQLMALVGGHPYLVRVAMFAASQEGVPIASALGDPRECERLFGPYLERYRARLDRSPELRDALRSVAESPSERPDPTLIHRLYSAGLIVRDVDARWRLRYRLYERLAR